MRSAISGRGRGLAAALVCVIAAAGTVAHGLQRPTSPIVGGNTILPVAFPDRGLAPKKETCDALGAPERRADVLLVTMGAAGRATPPVRLTFPGVEGSSTVRDWGDGVVAIPLPAGARNGAPQACLTNLGRSPLFIAGYQAGAPDGKLAGNRPVGFSLSFRLATEHPPTWADELGSTLRRVGNGWGGVGAGGSGWLVVVLFAGAVGAAAAGVGRWAR